MYVSGIIDGDVYLGNVYKSRLVSQEKDAVSLELYPLNTLTLRKVATLPVYLLNEKGEPYTGNVTIRAGVYRNGTLCADAKYTTTAGDAADIAKDVISSGLAAYGQTQKNMAASAKNLLVNNVKQGGFSSVGGGFGYEWSSDFQVGPVPMFLELGVGISAAVEFNAAVNHVEQLNNYLTQLQVKAYLKAFGGFVFDYAIVAFKLGIFGELSLDAQMRWLDAAKQRTQFGYKVTLAGEVGVKVEIAVLFFSYSKVLWSQGFEADLGTSRNWNSIENYWKEVGTGKSGAGGPIVPEGANLLAYDAATGTALLSTDQETALVDRDFRV